MTRALAGLALCGALLAVTGSACAPSKGTIGALLAQDREGRLFVREVPSGLAAAQAGLEVGDEILLIDGRDARAMGAGGVHEALSGEVGEQVFLTLVRRGAVLRITLERTKAQKYRLSSDTVPE